MGIFFKKNIAYLFLIGIILALSFFISFNNLFSYDTWWADDGGAHIAYVKTIVDQNRLPLPSENYLAWHEPGFYALAAVWTKIGRFFGQESLNWQEALNLIFFYLFLGSVWLLTYFAAQKNKYIALLNFFIFTSLFTGVKLAAYVNNEILAQTLIVFLAFLFIYLSLLAEKKEKAVVFWAIILALAFLVKITALIVLLAASISWLIQAAITKKKCYLFYILFTFFVVLFLNLPWLVYKHDVFGRWFTLNYFERENRQKISESAGWSYLLKINPKVFTINPYWSSPPHSAAAIFISDSFGDYYNLFNNPEKIRRLPTDGKIMVDNGRETTPSLYQSMLNVNRLGLTIFVIWLIGFFGYLFQALKNKKIDRHHVFLLILLFGGYSALVYNNLRYPYLERGTLKAAFILFTFPLLTLFSYLWYWQKINNKFLWVAVAFLPFILYLIFAWPVLIVK